MAAQCCIPLYISCVLSFVRALSPSSQPAHAEFRVLSELGLVCESSHYTTSQLPHPDASTATDISRSRASHWFLNTGHRLRGSMVGEGDSDVGEREAGISRGLAADDVVRQVPVIYAPFIYARRNPPVACTLGNDLFCAWLLCGSTVDPGGPGRVEGEVREGEGEGEKGTQRSSKSPRALLAVHAQENSGANDPFNTILRPSSLTHSLIAKSRRATQGLATRESHDLCVTVEHTTEHALDSLPSFVKGQPPNLAKAAQEPAEEAKMLLVQSIGAAAGDAARLLLDSQSSELAAISTPEEPAAECPICCLFFIAWPTLERMVEYQIPEALQMSPGQAPDDSESGGDVAVRNGDAGGGGGLEFGSKAGVEAAIEAAGGRVDGKSRSASGGSNGGGGESKHASGSSNESQQESRPSGVQIDQPLPSPCEFRNLDTDVVARPRTPIQRLLHVIQNVDADASADAHSPKPGPDTDTTSSSATGAVDPSL
ncbi:hypothetical protein BJY52DRAFT_1228147 [Lactarius psammicola]|nr:hypothetical protein BJY52DRAFT_1228147 [Lactarius psammicola]